MTTIWICIAAAAAISFLIKGVGPALLGDRPLPPRARGAVALVAPALIASLVVVDVAGPRWADFDPALAAGVVAAVGARLLRAPLLVSVVVAVLTTALLRLVLG